MGMLIQSPIQAMRTNRRRLNRGFTLIEALVTLAIVALLMMAAAPPMMSMLSRNQAESAKTSLATSISYARAEAMRTGLSVIVQSDGSTAGNELGQGWKVYADANHSGGVNAGDTMLRAYEASPASVTISGPTSITITPAGYLGGGASQTYTICHLGADSSSALTGYGVIVAPSGAVLTNKLGGSGC